MQILKELSEIDRSMLIESISQQHHMGDMQDALRRRYCYRVEIYSEDFSIILINSSVHSSTYDIDLNYSDYPTLKETVDSLSENMDFFEITRMNGKLSGSKV